MRFQVPQFVDIEDRIIGPFTLKQFLMYVAAVLLLVPVYLVSDLSLFFTIAIPVLGVAALFAHFRLHGKSLFTVLYNAARFLTHSQMYLWRRGSPFSTIRLEGVGGMGDEEAAESTSPLRNQARQLETQGTIVKEDAEDPIAG